MRSFNEHKLIRTLLPATAERRLSSRTFLIPGRGSGRLGYQSYDLVNVGDEIADQNSLIAIDL